MQLGHGWNHLVEHFMDENTTASSNKRQDCFGISYDSATKVPTVFFFDRMWYNVLWSGFVEVQKWAPTTSYKRGYNPYKWPKIYG